MSTRIYRIVDKATDTTRLVEAPNQARALQHVVATRFVVDIPTVNEAIALGANGVKVEQIGGATPAQA